MSGLRKSGQQRCLMRLYEQKGMKYDIKEILEFSTLQLKHKIKKLRSN